MKNKIAMMVGLMVFSSLINPHTTLGQPPPFINYQGRLVDGTNLFNGTLSTLYLNLYSVPTGGTMLYSDESINQPVVDGLYSTFIGDGSVFGNLDTALTNLQVWLEVVVNGTPLTPRERLVSVPYARMVHGLYVDENSNIILNPHLSGHSVSNNVSNSVIGGGISHVLNGFRATISGGAGNQVNATLATVGGGGRIYPGAAGGGAP